MKEAFGKKVTFYALVGLMIIEAASIITLSKVNDNSYNVALEMRNMTTEHQSILIDDTIKKQQELTSNQIRQSLLNYISKNDMKLVNKDKEWNKEELEEVLNVIVEPIKVFGNKGGITVFDSITGDVFLDTSPHNRKGKNIKDATTNAAEIKKLMEKRDTISEEGIVYTLDKGMTNPKDFAKFPLGKYNREFIEKIILPFESFGFTKGKQLTILISANEEDIFKKYVNGYDSINEDVVRIEKGAKMIAIVTGGWSILTVVIAMYLLYSYKKHNP